MDPPRLTLPEGRNGMLHILLSHQLIGNGQVLAIPDLLEVPPDKLLVGLRHRPSLTTALYGFPCYSEEHTLTPANVLAPW